MAIEKISSFDKIPFNTNAAISPANIKKFFVTPGDGEEGIDLTGAVSQFYFYESVLSNYVEATIEIVDSGFFMDSDGSLNIQPGGVLSGTKTISPIIGGSRVDFDIEDNKYSNKVDDVGLGTRLDNLKMDDGMYVSRIRDMSTSTLKNYFAIDLVSKEAFSNELTRVSQRYDGNIAENVKKILKNVVGVDEKSIEVEDTLLDYNFIGNDRKPFHVCTTLASKSVPLPLSDRPTLNRRAGFLFFQTRLGFHFISLANRALGELNKKGTLRKPNVINTQKGRSYNFSVRTFGSTSSKQINPNNFDDLILDYSVNTQLDVQKDLSLGTYNNRTIFFDFYSMNYVVRDFDIIENVLKTDLQRPVSDKQLQNFPIRELTKTPSRLMSHVLDVGTLPAGTNSAKQLEAWKNNPTSATFKASETMVQSIMAYNSIFREKLNITIAGDFSMVPGNTVYCSFQAIGSAEEDDKNLTGDYMISDVCHRVTPTETFTTMDLVPLSKIL